MNPARALLYVRMLAALRFFPQVPDALGALALEISTWTDDEKDLEWLVRECLRTWNEWPGPAALRELFLTRYPIKENK